MKQARAAGDTGVGVGLAPRATYRVQLTPQFGFRELGAIVPYLSQLGISHVYLSPCLEAVSGSSHGYDVTDPTRVRQDFGGESECAAALARCRERELGVLLDIVPNHMAASPENPWWRDLLRWGPASPYASYYDVDWTRHEGRLLLPILGMGRGAAPANGGIRLELGPTELALRVDEQRLPVAARSLSVLLHGLSQPGSELDAQLVSLDACCKAAAGTREAVERVERRVVELIQAEPLRGLVLARLQELDAAPDRLQPVLEAQHYRLRFWRAGLDEINYRRFFDVSSLAALRVEDRAVFDTVHVQIRRWLEQGAIAGVRVDHPDGLKDPEQYFQRLRELVGPGWVIAEKILEPGERLPSSWPIDGTTGYDFLNVASRLFVDPSAEAEMTATYCRLAELPSYDFERAMHAAKGRALRELFGAEVAALTARALPACEGERGRAFSAGDVQRALVALITGLPVYRTYLSPGHAPSAADRQYIELARRYACAEEPDLATVVKRLVDLLLGTPGLSRHEEFATAFQQLSGPAMAKGLEDTVFYDDARLIALNEVGGDPAHFGASVDEFHAFASELHRCWPKTLLATSTHDTKRSEDVRLRIALLSEMPGDWASQSQAWMQRARALPGGGSVDPRTLYFLLQTLVGAWPIGTERLQPYLLKAVREAKAWTSWLSPDQPREAALCELVTALLAHPEFQPELTDFVARLLPAFQRHSLSLTLLKLTAPGVPDIYQGTERWDFSLADPDNRRPVDYAARAALLTELAEGLEPEAVLARPAGEAKTWLIERALGVRRQHPECFDARGTYAPLLAVGRHAKHVVSFARGGRVVCVAPRLTFSLSGWADTRVPLPAGTFRNALTGERVEDGRLATLLSRFPVALLVKDG